MSDTSPATPETGADFAAVALLAGLQGVDASAQRLLKVITDPAIAADANMDGDTHAEVADEYEENFSGYTGFGYNDEVQTVADFLYNHYASDATVPDFLFGFECNADGEVGGYNVAIRIDAEDWQDRIALVEFHDIKHSTTNREASGLKAALAIAESLEGDYRSLLAKARRRGLLTAPANLVAIAANRLAACDATPPNVDVDVDTLASLRDVLAALIDAQGGTTTD